MRNELTHENGIFYALVNKDNGEDRVFVNGTELPQSSWVGTGAYTFVSGSVTVTIRRVEELAGNIMMVQEDDNTFYLVSISEGGGGGQSYTAGTGINISSTNVISAVRNQNNTYTKTEVDNLLNEIDLSEYVKKTQLNTASTDGLVLKGTGQINKVWKTNASGVPGWEDDADTWQANTVDQDGYVLKGTGQAGKAWITDANGNPAWRDVPLPKRTLIKDLWSSGSITVPKSQNQIILFRVYWKHGNIYTDYYGTAVNSNVPAYMLSYYYSASYCGCVGLSITNSATANTFSFNTSWMRQIHGSNSSTGMDAILYMNVWTYS